MLKYVIAVLFIIAPFFAAFGADSEATGVQATLPIAFPSSAAELNQLVARKFQALCADYETRLEQARLGDKSVLEKGFWYADDYFSLLEKQPPRKKWFLDRNYFFHGYPPKNKLKLLKSPRACSGYEAMSYELVDGVSPSQGLDGLVNDLCFVDCGILFQIAYYQALRDIWGEATFNQYFAAQEGFFVTSSVGLTKLKRLVTEVVIEAGPRNSRNVRVGAKYYIRNHPIYAAKEMNGEAQGFNIMCIDGTPDHQLFIGFGLPSEGISEDQVVDRCIAEFNKKPRNAEICTEEVWRKIVASTGLPYEMKMASLQELSSLQIDQRDFESNGIASIGLGWEQLQAQGMGESGFLARQGEVSLDYSKVRSAVGSPTP